MKSEHPSVIEWLDNIRRGQLGWTETRPQSLEEESALVEGKVGPEVNCHSKSRRSHSAFSLNQQACVCGKDVCVTQSYSLSAQASSVCFTKSTRGRQERVDLHVGTLTCRNRTWQTSTEQSESLKCFSTNISVRLENILTPFMLQMQLHANMSVPKSSACACICTCSI